jgi:cyclic lactone autoinducer peptide
MKKKVEKSLLSIVEKVVRVEVQKNNGSELQICPFILHQPKRPKKQQTGFTSSDEH